MMGEHSRRNLLRLAMSTLAAAPLACYGGDGTATQADSTGASEPASTTGDDTPTTSAGDSTGDSTGDASTGEPVDCYSTRDFFADRVWAPLMSSNCAMCHEPTGVAAEKGAKFRLLTPVYPGFIEANIENIKSLAGYEYEGVPLLLAKPTGLVDHGGGVQLSEGTQVFDDLAELIAQLDAPVECAPKPPSAAFPDVSLLTPEETLRKAALHLVGRLPTADERSAVADGGEPALLAALDAFMQEDAFYDRLADIYNDVFFTDTYLVRDGVQFLNAATPDFPNVTKYLDTMNPLPADQKARVKKAVAREPLSLVQYIVRNDLPLTDLLLAPYTVFTPDSAWLYGVDAKFDDPNNPNELQPGVLKVTRNGKPIEYPHAGVLTSPMWLNRFPTTPTNRNRHRARKVYDQFLATDVLALASQAIDPAAGSTFSNPTRDASECAKCHRVIDPIAGGFQMFDKNNQEFLLDPPVWYPEMFAPGYGNELMPADLFATGVRWLAERVAADPRFSLATTYTIFAALTGQKPLRYPTDTASPDYKSLLAAWQVQDELLRSISEEFIAANYDLKLIIREVIRGPYYRGIGMSKEPSAARRAELVAVGTGRLSTPELLTRKIQSVTGVRWGGTGTDLLVGEYKILYGGIDSFDVTQRLTATNQIMAAVATRMAIEVACIATAFDFSKPMAERLLFPLVDPVDTPDFNEGAIRKNIAHLHDRVLGEVVAEDSPEVDATLALFYDTWTAGVQSIADKTETTSLGSCQALKDPTTNTDLPAERQIKLDETYAIRAWQAVIIYLLSDYKFLYE
ncbi:DUF1588 domain-containing protein [Nannocystis sp.]|uniref:DUF1588 domain-containing protein n=1 Tax=Nannocystis sp. TaxID=1962667 RepID=UPI0025FCA06A|nr:DUF1588 domain-containing protein [Nannocystis sp.]MBK7829947.1 DUF1588 domain-containing protein [Nannocystis sp.]